ncbi:MAG: AAA family ATPase [Clostridia bacterium]|nr:AAA family ATPase [Clostridia bacterium]
MKIISAYVENFGKISQKQFNFDEELTEIDEKNGWGKTTLAMFIKVLLYGFKDTRKKNINENERLKYKPWNNGIYGGNLIIQYKGEKYKIEKSFGKTLREDETTIINLQTNKIDRTFSENIGEDIFKLDRESFERSIYVGQQVVEVRTSDDLRAKLTKLDAIGEDDMDKYKEATSLLDNKIQYLKKKLKVEDERKKYLETRILEYSQIEHAYNNSIDEVKSMRVEKNNILNNIENIEKDIKRHNENQVKEEKRKRFETLKKSRDEKYIEKQEIINFFNQDELERDKNLESLEDGILKQEDRYERNKILRKEIDMLKLKEQYKTEEFDEIKLENLKRDNKILICGVLALIVGLIFLKNIIGIILILVGVVLLGFYMDMNRKKKSEYEILKQKKDKIKLEIEEIQNQIMQFAEEMENNNEQAYEFIKRYIKDISKIDISDGKYLQELHYKRTDLERIINQYEESEKQVREFEENNNIDELMDDETVIETKEKLEIELQRLKDCKEILLHNLTAKEKEVQIFESNFEEKQELEEELQNKEDTIKEFSCYLEKIEKTRKILGQAQENLSTRYLKKMKDGLKKYLDIISENDDNIKDVTINTELEVCIEFEGKSKELGYYSIGYKDLISLATRFALIDAIFDSEKPFIILDDPFVNLDKDKIENANDLIRQISKKYQIIYFTCHESRNIGV